MRPKCNNCEAKIKDPSAQEIRGNYLYTNGRPLGGQDNFAPGDSGTIRAGKKK